jgi:hypothetical protein
MHKLVARLGFAVLLMTTFFETPAGAGPGCIPWKIVPTPTNPLQEITGIDGVSATDFWAVGDAFIAAPPTILHWDGTAWTKPPVQAVIGGLESVDVISQDDAWAVGGLAMHRDGSAWTEVPVPSHSGLRGVSATGPSDVWAVGTRRYSQGPDHALARHELDEPAPPPVRGW